MRRIGRWAWSKIAHPKVVTIFTVIGYAWLLYGWIPGLLNPPGSLEGQWGSLTMYMIGGLIVLGSAVGIPAAVVGKNRIERRSVWAVIAGITLYVILVHVLHYTGDGNRIPQAGTMAALLSPLLLRWIHVMKCPVAPDKETLIGKGADVGSDLDADDQQ